MAEPEREVLRRKYDALAPRYATHQYADPAAIARRQVELVRRWGTPAPPGASVLEIGCADGFVTEALARAGYRVTAVDLSPAMVAAARRRLTEAGLDAEILEADLDGLSLGRRFDVVLAVMWNFFHYATDPEAALARLVAHTAGKLIADADPRRVRPWEAARALAAAGLVRVAWRPFLVPQTRTPARPALRVLASAELVPGLRTLSLRLKPKFVVKGEVPA